VVEQVGELSLWSEAFRTVWARHDIRQKRHETKRFRHPLVGQLTLEYESLTISSAPGQQPVVHRAESGGPTAHVLALLGSITATRTAQPSDSFRQDIAAGD
jgi:hypothetical protein